MVCINAYTCNSQLIQAKQRGPMDFVRRVLRDRNIIVHMHRRYTSACARDPPNQQRLASLAILFRYMCDPLNSNIILYTVYGARDRSSAHIYTLTLFESASNLTNQSQLRAHRYAHIQTFTITVHECVHTGMIRRFVSLFESQCRSWYWYLCCCCCCARDHLCMWSNRALAFH